MLFFETQQDVISLGVPWRHLSGSTRDLPACGTHPRALFQTAKGGGATNTRARAHTREGGASLSTARTLPPITDPLAPPGRGAASPAGDSQWLARSQTSFKYHGSWGRRGAASREKKESSRLGSSLYWLGHRAPMLPLVDTKGLEESIQPVL